MKKEKSFYSFDQFNEVLELSENNDKLINKLDRLNCKKGNQIGTLGNNGYLKFGLWGHMWLVHRVIWLLYYKKWPDEFLDHINRNKTENSILNLREASKSKNAMNSKRRFDNSTSQKCISFDKRRGKWYIRVWLDQKKYWRGYYENLEDAIKARDKLVTQLHGDFANLS